MDFLDEKYLATRPFNMIGNVTFSGYKLSDVKKRLEESLRKKNGKEAVLWAGEVHLSNHVE